MFSKSIRRALIASGLVIGATAAFSPTAFAQVVGDVQVSGSVASTLAMTSVTTGGATTLDLDGDGTSGEHIVQVADIAIATNNEQGYTLTVSSGDLTKAGGSSIPYQVTTVLSAQPAPASGSFTIASGTDYQVVSPGAGSVPQDLYIKYIPAALQDAGVYGATINLNVADN